MKPGLHPRLVRRWTDDPVNPRRATFDDDGVVRLASSLVPGSRRGDLGDVMSLNVLLDSAGTW